MDLLPEYTGATFSSCRRYRYRLWRYWAPGEIRLCFVGLNPSTADETVDDPTISRMMERAMRWGYGGLEVVNLFAWRATDPAHMIGADDPVGPDNDSAIMDVVQSCEMTICGWGKHGTHLGRAQHVMSILKPNPRLRALKLNKDGGPAHPLYLPYSLQPVAI